MNLTNYEKEMLDGVHGETMQLAMGALCELGGYYGVERFVEIVACHDDSTVYLGEAQVAFAERLVKLGRVFPFPPPPMPVPWTCTVSTGRNMTSN